jgi:hypothetical protein
VVAYIWSGDLAVKPAKWYEASERWVSKKASTILIAIRTGSANKYFFIRIV